MPSKHTQAILHCLFKCYYELPKVLLRADEKPRHSPAKAFEHLKRKKIAVL